MTDKLSIDDIKIVTPKVRLAWPHLFEPHAFENEQQGKFKARLLFSKDLIKNDPEYKAFWAKFKGICMKLALQEYDTKDKIPKTFDWGIRNGDTPENSALNGHYGCYFMNTKSAPDKAPQIVDKDPNVKITAESDRIYGGCYVNAIVFPYCYKVGSNSGIGFALKAIQFEEDGEKFASSIDVSKEFKTTAAPTAGFAATVAANDAPDVDEMDIPF